MLSITKKITLMLIASFLSFASANAENAANVTAPVNNTVIQAVSNLSVEHELTEYYAKIKELKIQRRMLFKNLSPAAKEQIKMKIQQREKNKK